MLKISTLLFTFSGFLLISACSEPHQSLTYEEFFKSSKALNWFAISGNTHADDGGVAKFKAMPFDEGYLKSRHRLLHSVDMAVLSEEHRNSINYLKIQERYPERFFAWSPHLDVLARADRVVSQDSLNSWLMLVLARLREGYESKVILSRLERAQLLKYLTQSDYDSKEKQALVQYLSEYKVRSGIGLYQLPNGKEWYQSKLNFYSGQTHDPHELAAFLSAKTDAVDEPVESNINNIGLRLPAILQITSSYCEAKSGLNWRDSYVDVEHTLANCYQYIPLSDLKVLTVLAEVDLGIHLYAWSQRQAMHRLQSRLALNDALAHALLNNIAFHPATNMAILPYIKASSKL
ncbi:hypothetical protein [Pseudoalteromonas luteoviolacea]|nr:hypothetical protein [Pseudoalteromonas luteoviolacea]